MNGKDFFLVLGYVAVAPTPPRKRLEVGALAVFGMRSRPRRTDRFSRM